VRLNIAGKCTLQLATSAAELIAFIVTEAVKDATSAAMLPLYMAGSFL